jgi:hypothetical protein
MSRAKFCNYDEGMFTQEPWELPTELNIVAHMEQREATQFHEAGHAAIQYVLGLGISNIELGITKTIAEENEVYSYHGKSIQSKSVFTRLVRRLDKGDFCAEVLAHGIASAAGPAAERKYYLTRGAPIRTFMASEGDHVSIDYAAKNLERQGRNRFAYRRLVWRRAQLALENETIWSAIEDLADILSHYFPLGEAVGTETETVPGATARAIMRRKGVRVATGSGFPCSVFAKCDQKTKLGKMASRCDHFIEM